MTERCPRCKGEVFLNRDIFGAYYECVRCGCTGSPDGDHIKWPTLAPSTDKPRNMALDTGSMVPRGK